MDYDYIISAYIKQSIIYLIITLYCDVTKKIFPSKDLKFESIKLICMVLSIFNATYCIFNSMFTNDVYFVFKALFLDYIVAFLLIAILNINLIYETVLEDPKYILIGFFNPTIIMIDQIYNSTKLQKNIKTIITCSIAVCIELCILLFLEYAHELYINPINIYISVSIFLVNIMLISFYMFNVRNIWLRLLLIILAAYNITISMSVYGLIITMNVLCKPKKK